MLDSKNIRSDAIGQIRDLLTKTHPEADPFLFRIPEILNDPQFVKLDPLQTLDFVRLAVSYERPQIVREAVNILNRMIGPDGSFNKVHPTHLQESRGFLWSEFGDHTDPMEAFQHILNKTLFLLSMSQ